MGELILIPTGASQILGQEIHTVNARDLHDFLGVGKDYSNWIKKRIEQYKFKENEDFIVFAQTGENLQGGRPAIEYRITLDMAKELSMVERTERGKQARKYFIECEKKLRDESFLVQNKIALEEIACGISSINQIKETLKQNQENFERRLLALESRDPQPPSRLEDSPTDHLVEELFVRHVQQMSKVNPDVRNFLIEKTILNPDSGTLLSWIYTIYEQWCFALCKIPLGKIQFYSECRLALNGFSEIKAYRGNRLYATGVRLRDDK